MNFLRRIFGKSTLSREALIAYHDKLPEVISVRWFRDGKLIVGEVEIEGNKFFTQGTNADDFMEMVNDAIITVKDIPKDYIDTIRDTKTYKPSLEEENKLRDAEVNGSIISAKKNRKVFEAA